MKLLKNIFNDPNLKNGFLRVKENRGCAGVDGITIEEFERDLERNLDRLR